MKTKKSKTPKSAERNEDPITHAPGAHPVSTGVGAASAGVIGVAIGTAVAGPVGALVGAAVGGVVGGLGGSAAGEALDPSSGIDKPRDTDGMDLGSDTHPDATGFPIAPIGMGAGMPFGGGILGADAFPPAGFVPFIPQENGDENAASAGPRRDEIAERAWSIYEAEGRPEGKSDEHWARAERELRR